MPLQSMKEKIDYKAAITAEKVRLNNLIADYNNLVADLTSGAAIYAARADRAVEGRMMACKTRILGLPKAMARTLVMKTRPQIIAELGKHLEEAIRQLSDLHEDEITAGETIEDLPEEYTEADEES
jgi:hypothetical protein